MLNTLILIYIYIFKCEIKTASTQQVTDNKWVIAIEQNHLNGWFNQERSTVIAQKCKTVLWLCLDCFLFFF